MTDTREAIRESARDLYLEGGLRGFSMRKVGSRVGVSATAIYRHFEDKDALLFAVLEEGFRRFGEYLMRSLSSKNALQRLCSTGEAYVDFAVEHPRDYELMFMANCSDLGLERMGDGARARMKSTFLFLVDRIRECIDAGDLAKADPEQTAFIVWGHIHGLCSLWITDRAGGLDLPAFRQLMTQSIQTTVRGFSV